MGLPKSVERRVRSKTKELLTKLRGYDDVKIEHKQVGRDKPASSARRAHPSV